MSETLNAEIEAAQSKLREIDNNLHSLTGRNTNDRVAGVKRRISYENDGDRRSGGLTVVSSVSGNGFSSRRISMDNDDRKRVRRDSYDNEDDYDDRPKRSLQSLVVMPTIETKSREAAISESKASEKKEVTNRNRRMFSSLLMGTLQKFKTEKKVETQEKAQAEKLREVEKRLEASKKEEREKAMAERSNLQQQRREQEREVRELTRKRALMQYADQKVQHYRKLQQFIQTKTNPTIFFLPAKHTISTLELLKASAKTIDGLIELREKELERSLNATADADHEQPEVRSVVMAKRSRDERSATRSDDEDDEEEEAAGEGEKVKEESAEEQDDDEVVLLPDGVEPVKEESNKEADKNE